MIPRPSLPASARAAPIASSHGQRSSSVSGVPADILATLAAGWNSSAARKATPRCLASAAPTVDLPLPLTPMTTTATGDRAESGEGADMRGLGWEAEGGSLALRSEDARYLSPPMRATRMRGQ